MVFEPLQHCWQYEIRQRNLAKDLEQARLTHAKMATLRVCDFEFCYVPKDDKEMCQKIKNFIIKYEWLGKMPHRPTHRFIATYQGQLAGAIVMATPNAFSNFLGKDSRDKEKLISRGACISWSPKNLASALIMYSIRWMSQNTAYRFFTGYSDTTAGELGTIYQACNFTYLGQKSGARFQYFDPQYPERGWFSDRLFRKSSQIRKYAQKCAMEWQKNWQRRDKILWDQMPSHVVFKIKSMLKKEMNRCIRRKIPKKHKYLYILGKNKRQTKRLRKNFAGMNPNLLNLPYPPKERSLNLETLYSMDFTKFPMPNNSSSSKGISFLA